MPSLPFDTFFLRKNTQDERTRINEEGGTPQNKKAKEMAGHGRMNEPG